MFIKKRRIFIIFITIIFIPSVVLALNSSSEELKYKGISGNVFQGNLILNSAAYFNKTLDVAKAVSFESSLRVQGVSFLNGTLLNENPLVALTVGDDINIYGNALIKKALHLQGVLNAQGTIYNASGSVRIGDDLKVDGETEVKALTVDRISILRGNLFTANIFPYSDSLYDIGSSLNRFRRGYFDYLYGDGSNLSNLNASQLTSGTISASLLPEDPYADTYINVNEAGAITSGMLVDGSVTGEKILNNTITDADISDTAAIDWSKISTTINKVNLSNQVTGSLSDSYLSQITTANKVAASAIEDKFLRNDQDDVMSGKLTVGSLATPWDNIIYVAKSGGDYTTISSALASITDSSSTNPYTIIVGPGVYHEKFTMKQYVKLKGSGIDISVIDGSTDLEADIVTMADNSEITGFTLKGAIAGTGQAALVKANNADCYIHNNKFEDTGSQVWSLTITGDSTVRVENNQFYNYGPEAIYLKDTSTLWAIGNHIDNENNGGAGIKVGDGQTAYIYNNYITGNNGFGGNGMALLLTGGTSYIHHNRLVGNNWYDIYVTGGSHYINLNVLGSISSSDNSYTQGAYNVKDDGTDVAIP